MDNLKYPPRRVPYVARVFDVTAHPHNLVGARTSSKPAIVLASRSSPSAPVGAQINEVHQPRPSVPVKDSAMLVNSSLTNIGMSLPSDRQDHSVKSKPAGRIERDKLRQQRRHLQQKLRRKSIRKQGIKVGASYVIALAIILSGGYVALRGAILNQQLEDQLRVLSASTQKSDDNSSQGGASAFNTASGIPSEEKPKANYLETYKVSPELPRIISIPAISVRTRVLQVGTDSNNELLTPKNIYDTAWYSSSAKPGELGTALIDGHYVGPTTKGVFSRINTLHAGDKVMIERGDGKRLSFTVARIETIPVTSIDMMQIVEPNNHTQPRLNLITCGGTYDAKTFHFSDRTIVYTVLDG